MTIRRLMPVAALPVLAGLLAPKCPLCVAAYLSTLSAFGALVLAPLAVVVALILMVRRRAG